jgi:hypothetical protein
LKLSLYHDMFKVSFSMPLQLHVPDLLQSHYWWSVGKLFVYFNIVKPGVFLPPLMHGRSNLLVLDCGLGRRCAWQLTGRVTVCLPLLLVAQDEAASWETRLSTLLEGLTLLQAIQRRWLYLEPIFGRGALPSVAGRFRHVDGEFKAIMMQLQVCGSQRCIKRTQCTCRFAAMLQLRKAAHIRRTFSASASALRNAVMHQHCSSHLCTAVLFC